MVLSPTDEVASSRKHHYPIQDLMRVETIPCFRPKWLKLISTLFQIKIHFKTAHTYIAHNI